MKIVKLNDFNVSLKMINFLFCVFSGIAVGIFIIGSKPLIVLTIFGGVVLLILVAFKPKIGILAIVFLISSIIFEQAIPVISIGFGSLHISDIFLLFLFCMIFFKLYIDKKFRFAKTPLDFPLILFFCATIIAAFIAVTVYKVNFNIVMRQFRYFTYYLLFFVITTLIQEKKEVKFIIRGLFVVSVIVGMAMILQAIVGESIHLMPGRIEAVETFGQTYASTRILPPGQTLIFVMFITGVCYAIFMNKPAIRSGFFYLLSIIGTAIILTSNRNYWVAILFSLSIFTLLVSKAHRKRIIAEFAIALILMSTVIGLLVGIGGKPREFAVSTLDRTFSLFSVEKLFSSGSIEWRKRENYYATRTILSHPIVGIGLGNSYRPRIFGSTDNLTHYTHNGYLWILWNMGFVGFIPFMWLCIAFLARGFLNWRHVKDDFLKAVMIGFTLSYVGIMLACLVNPMFMQWFSITIIGIMMGINEAIIRINEKSQGKI